ncbi:hypothetical protein ABE502_03105 [Stenotrophomonas sepilia]|uniref:hypothetical protein n=1 Tax=Stenotrophomonas sepilia TaxID=2860290 RepID=UPI00320A3145
MIWIQDMRLTSCSSEVSGAGQFLEPARLGNSAFQRRHDEVHCIAADEQLPRRMLHAGYLKDDLCKLGRISLQLAICRSQQASGVKV